MRTVTYSDGSQNRFVYDSVGNIIEAQNAYGKTQYGYDKGGRMIYQKDVTTGEEIYFTYDDAGNRIRLESSNRQTTYTYGKNNEVKEIFDNKQRISIKLEYNINGQETVRRFGNGTKEETLYDKAGRVTEKTQKNDRGDVLWGEGYVYGDDGKRTVTVDNLGRITFYEYNNKGQLSSVYYPYTQEMINNLKEEAEENGLSAITEAGENRFLTSSEKANIVPLLNSMQYGLAYNLTNMQVLIKESYVYDRNGNRTAKISPYGKIEYSYDKENYLLSSGSKGQSFVNYSYDVMGNLLTEESKDKTVKYAYNAQNRLIYCEITDRANKEYAQTTYAYDAFGRRILVQDKGEAALRSLYDGLTFDVIKQSPTFQNGQFTDSQNTGIKFGATGRPTGDRYRYLGDDETKDNNRYFYLDENTYKTTNSRYKGERTTINVNGTLAAQTTTEGTDYFSTDLLGSIRSVSDGYGKSKGSYTYDAFGTLVQGDLTGTTDFGYLGKQNDPTANLYNYGYRDYKPQTSRFTTIDPIRDGFNWFSYCNGDPVNFIDLLGLLADDEAVVNYDKIMQELQKYDLSNGVPFEYVFSKMKFNSQNFLNQLVLDKALGINSTSLTTKSCQTAAFINSYLKILTHGLTGADILAILKNEDGTFNKSLNSDGSPNNLNDLSDDIAKYKKFKKKIRVADEKTPPTETIDADVGVIVGLSKGGEEDEHFVFRDSEETIDSLDPNRDSAKDYSDNTYRKLYLEDVK